MKFITFNSSDSVHGCDDLFVPICGQTDANKGREIQEIIADAPTCLRCKAEITLRASLALCPFCPVPTERSTQADGKIHTVVCGTCGAQGPWGRSGPQAAARWNSRPVPQESKT